MKSNNYNPKKPIIILVTKIIIVVIIGAFVSCNTSKNTSLSRGYHNLTAHYNVYFNANESLKSGNRKLEKSDEDYSRVLPVFKYEDPNSVSVVSSDMDLAITKCAKTIKTHSITAKPKYNKKEFSQKERDFLSKPEYCKWIDDAYLIMGKAHFFKQDYETALQTFLLNINKFAKEPTKDEANLWLAKTYVELKDFKNAEMLLADLIKERGTDKKFMYEVELLNAAMYLKKKETDIAAQKLNKVLSYKTHKKEKPRLHFILAQIYQNNAEYALAIEHYKTVIKNNPNYDITFKSKINLAEIYEKSGANSSELKGQFLKMLKDEKNVDYQDQLYYALAKIEQNQKNIDKAIEYYELSAKSKSSNKTQKVKTHLALAELYYSRENYGLAEAYYDSTLTSIDPGFPEYETIYPQINSRRSLAKNLNIIYVEDSLQAFAKLSESERNTRIDKIIQKIQQEEQIALQESQNKASDPYMMDDMDYSRRTEAGTGANYYFYNPNSKSFGQTDFKKRWGDRKLEDNWRRSNKQSVLDLTLETDSFENKGVEKNEQKEQKLKNNKTKDFYLQNVPLTQEKMDASNKNIEKALFNLGNIYQKDIFDNQKAIGQYETLLNRYPKTEYRQDVLQILHKLYLVEANNDKAEKYKQLIVNEFPESMYAKMLSDPAFVQKIKKEQNEIEKLYQTAYERYNKKEYTEVIGYCEHSLKTYPDNYLAPKFLFLNAMAYGESGNKATFTEKLEMLVQKYPNEEVATRAKEILDLMAGRKFEEQIFLPSKDSVHYYVFIYPKDNIDLIRLKFKFISFNATQFTQDDLKISNQSLDSRNEMFIVQSFINAKSSLLYFQKVITEGLIEEYSAFSPSNFIISASNYQVLLKNTDIGKYLKFFDEQYLKN